MALKFWNYIDHIDSINFFKYDICLRYYDLRFRYGNVNPSGTHKFTFEVYGEVNLYDPRFDVREYLIYSEERTANVDEWVVRIPEIDAKSSWNTPPRNISSIAPIQNIYSGVGYSEPNLAGTGTAVLVGDIRVTANANILDIINGKYIPVNVNDQIKEYVLQYYGRYNDYPGLIIEGNGENNSQYYFIPVGVSTYKIIMRSATGESLTTVIPGSLQSKQYLSVGAMPTYNPNPNNVVPGTGNIIIKLDATQPNGSSNTMSNPVPNVIGKKKKDAKKIIENAGLEFLDGFSFLRGRRVEDQTPDPGREVESWNDEVYVYNYKND